VRTRTFRVAAGIALCVIGLGAAVVGAVAGFVVVGTDDVVTVRPKEFTAKGLAIVTGRLLRQPGGRDGRAHR